MKNSPVSTKQRNAKPEEQWVTQTESRTATPRTQRREEKIVGWEQAVSLANGQFPFTEADGGDGHKKAISAQLHPWDSWVS